MPLAAAMREVANTRPRRYHADAMKMRRALHVLAAFFAFAALLHDTALPQSRSAPAGARAAAEHRGKDLFLAVTARKDDTYRSIAQEFMGSGEHWKAIRALAPGRALRAGTVVRIPYDKLAPPYQRRVIEALYPSDAYDPARRGWVHKVAPYKETGETLWRIAEWFTGDGRNHAAIARANRMAGSGLSPGQSVLIPDDLLLPAFREPTRRPAPSPSPAPSPAPPPPVSSATVMGEGHPELGYGQDAEGPYAAYRLKAGEALYSAVVVRFTGLLTAEEVNRVALDIARRSGIDDVTNIPIGYAVKIPLDLLLPEYLPRGDARRVEYDALQESVAQWRPSVYSENLAGVHVLLDPGHGGVDVGASHHGVHERDYVYDVMCRVHRILTTSTKATSVPLMRNRELGFVPHDRERLPPSTAAEVLTTPPFRYAQNHPAHRSMHVNLRWYLANDHYRRLRRQGVPAEKIIFVSIHADALHPSVRGAMIYIPGAPYAASTVGGSGGEYAAYREVREHPTVTVSASDKMRSQGYSHAFAQSLLAALRAEKIAVHPYHPVRDSIVRAQGRPWSPAVLRNNLVPTKILFETANLANAQDAALMRSAAFRESLARALVEALNHHYTKGSAAPPRR